jgi:hypothetical protein
VDTPNIMNCPNCQKPMEEGVCVVCSSPVGSVVFGVSREHLWFRPADANAEMVLMSRIQRNSFRCVPCGLVVVEGGADRAAANRGEVL